MATLYTIKLNEFVWNEHNLGDGLWQKKNVFFLFVFYSTEKHPTESLQIVELLATVYCTYAHFHVIETERETESGICFEFIQLANIYKIIITCANNPHKRTPPNLLRVIILLLQCNQIYEHFVYFYIFFRFFFVILLKAYLRWNEL